MFLVMLSPKNVPNVYQDVLDKVCHLDRIILVTFPSLNARSHKMNGIKRRETTMQTHVKRLNGSNRVKTVLLDNYQNNTEAQ